jgi:hypothetical protein
MAPGWLPAADESLASRSGGRSLGGCWRSRSDQPAAAQQAAEITANTATDRTGNRVPLPRGWDDRGGGERDGIGTVGGSVRMGSASAAGSCRAADGGSSGMEAMILMIFMIGHSFSGPPGRRENGPRRPPRSPLFARTRVTIVVGERLP